MNCKRLRDLQKPLSSLRTVGSDFASTKITIPLGELLPVLVEAMQTHRIFLNDFLDEEITLSRDFHEVLKAFNLNFGPTANEVA